MLVCWNPFPIANKKHLRLYESNNIIIISIYIYTQYALNVAFDVFLDWTHDIWLVCSSVRIEEQNTIKTHV